MGLIVDFEIDETDGCRQWLLSDTAGVYDATTNPGGWGSPNPATTDNSTITFLIKKYGDTVGYLITLTTVAGLITTFTITDPNGIVTDWFPTLASNHSFINDSAIPFPITPAMLGLTDVDATFDADAGDTGGDTGGQVAGGDNDPGGFGGGESNGGGTTA